MQLRLQPRSKRSLISKGLLIKIALIVLVFLLGIFLVDKIDFPSPKELIKQEISNDKIIKLK